MGKEFEWVMYRKRDLVVKYEEMFYVVGNQGYVI